MIAPWLVGVALPFPAAAATERLRLATTTSTENSGLLEVLLPPFETRCGCKVDVIAVGSGKALKLAEAGDVDVVFVHAEELEEKFVSAGHGVKRRRVMYNVFLVIGPREDPAGVKSAATAVEAMRRIAAGRGSFVSRGDESGTHQKEKQLWRAAATAPGGRWYIEAGLGMGAVIHMTDQRRGYTLADMATYQAYRDKTDLAVLFRGDPLLVNPYSVIAVNPERHPHVSFRHSEKFIDYLSGEEAQEIIINYRINGEPAFFVSRGREE